MTPEIMAKKPSVPQVLGLASALVGGVVLARFVTAKKINGAERLAESLLHTERLRDAARTLPDGTSAVLACCAAYLVEVAFRAAEGVGAVSGTEDPVGYSRTHTHPYTRAAATVLTESAGLDQTLTYAVVLPDLGEIRGIRRIGSLRMSGLSPARPAPDTVQFSLGEGYSAQLESEFEIADYLVTGRTRIFGAATLRDNQGNAGRLNIGYDGTVTGTVTRDSRIVGRFEGQLAKGVRFTQYQIEGDTPA